jgi:hypothetical protein
LEVASGAAAEALCHLGWSRCRVLSLMLLHQHMIVT